MLDEGDKAVFATLGVVIVLAILWIGASASRIADSLADIRDDGRYPSLKGGSR